MSRTLSDFSQLSKAMFKAAPKADEVKPEPPKSKSHDEGEEVLAYFSRPAAGAETAQKAPTCAPAAEGATDRTAALERDVAALRAQLRDSEAARKDAEARMTESDRKCADAAVALEAARRDVMRLQGECGRLQGEARKAAQAAPVVEDAKDEPLAAQAAETPRSGVLAAPGAFAEAFPGEVREMILAVLSDARDAARQSTRERRAAVLDAVLAANRPTGELDRRRAELKQILKDAGYYTDPHALEELGFKLVSGRTHWKLEYAGVRMPIAKTPSDYRANLNMAADMANRCF